MTKQRRREIWIEAAFPPLALLCVAGLLLWWWFNVAGPAILAIPA